MKNVCLEYLYKLAHSCLLLSEDFLSSWPKEEKQKYSKWSMITSIDRDIPYSSKVSRKGQTRHSTLNETKVAVGEGSHRWRDCFCKLDCH